jgi:hypothetical protein
MSALGDLRDLRDEVAEKITAHDLLAAYGVTYRKGGGRNELQAKQCPRRRDHSDFGFRFNEASKRWQCFPCGIGGDAFTFVAEMEGLDCKTDWRRVLARAAEIAGVTPNTEPTADRRRRMEQLRADRTARDLADRAQAEASDTKAISTASAYWRALKLRDPAGEQYLAQRGVPDIARMNGRVRFDRTDLPGRDGWSSDGAPSLAIYDLRGRGVAGVVRRRLPSVVERDPRPVKAPTLTGCQGGGTMAYELADITAGRDVVVTEGIADTITALAAWPAAVVLGANGVGPMPNVVGLAARRVKQHRGLLYVVAHADERRQGETAVIPCTRAALDAGLRMESDLILVDLGNANDLNDAWISGWRPS